MALAVAGCATTAGAPLAAGAQAAVEGTVVSVDTQPWTYDGHAVVEIDTRGHGRMAVHLPARWNLCKAPPVEVEALAVGMPVRAVGTVGAEGEMMVCESETHRLVPVD
ncbi:hypothetical protein H0E84_09150 [Luteimonas sp. SJ-92]|uniref:DUF5666 domain-containing protein n=1 Tax=Luteimonas salinisoli TaxID=2752307 RepID=A0A853JCS0_9GAMM|nr:hypothetical protein [Luteimonas salinisoli]NZA26552.1 hypothetical protein [Luteimonas salinisoli]